MIRINTIKNADEKTLAGYFMPCPPFSVKRERKPNQLPGQGFIFERG